MQFRSHFRPIRIGLVLLLCALIAWLALVYGQTTTPTVIGKGRVIGNHMRTLTNEHAILQNLANLDPVTANYLNGKNVDLLTVNPLGHSVSVAQLGTPCADCELVTFYNYTDEGTINAIFDPASATYISAWADQSARPNPSGYIVEKVVDIAAADAAVTAQLGNIHKAEVAMVPMSTWLQDDDCNDDWCIDLTFLDPDGSGKIFHVIVNLSQDKVARTFLTRGRPERAKIQDDTLDENADLFSNGCHEANGWDVCWEMTPHDGVNFYNAHFNNQLIFSSAKIGQVEAFYPSWPGGYRDEIGYEASVPPKFDTRLTELDGGFEVRQLFTEPFNWPNCICCYRYEQIIQFYEDGSFEPRFISHGPGCDELSQYRPFWRFDVDLNGSLNDQAWYWGETGWIEAEDEVDLQLFEDLSLDGQRLAIFDEDLHYRWQPVATDPLNLDDGRLFVVNEGNNEGQGSILTGPANSYLPPMGYVDGDELDGADSNMVIWYVSTLKTKKGGPWWCAPDPAPDVSPCESILRVVPAGKLVQPTEQELTLANAVIPTPEPTPADETLIAVAPTRRPTPRAIAGASAEQIILNSGCGACHAIGDLGEAGKVGPSLSNIGNVAAKRVPGQSAETYLRNSILYPNIYLAPGCPNSDCLADIMPTTYHLTLSDGQVQVLVDYMLTLQQDEAAIVGDGTAVSEIGAAGNGEGVSAETQPSAPQKAVDAAQDLVTEFPPLAIIFAFVTVGLLLIIIGLVLNMKNKAAFNEDLEDE